MTISTNPRPTLRLEHLEYRPILSATSLELAPGRLLAVIGPNGAGKSTLLRLLAGFLQPTGGAALLGGTETRRIPGRQRGCLLGYLPQNVGTSFPFTALEIVRMGSLCRVDQSEKESQEEAREQLEQLGLGEMIHRPFPSLSGGEQRLVLAAKMLMQQPAWMLLDEPTDALDWPNARALLTHLSQLAASGHGVVCVLHDLNLVWQMDLDVLLLHKGQMLAHSQASALDLKLLSQAYATTFTQLKHPASGAPILVQG